MNGSAMSLVAIDSGKSGALARYYPTSGIAWYYMPDAPGLHKMLLGWKEQAKRSGRPMVVCVEEPPRYYKRAPGKEPATSRISLLFENYGFLRGLLYGLGISHHTVRPQDWQKCFAKRNGAAYADWKRMLRDVAQSIFPQIDVTIRAADALLMLEYMMRLRGVRTKNPETKLGPGVEQTQLAGV